MDRKSAKDVLAQFGFESQFVAAGMEGLVFDIGNARIAKVWIKKEYGEVEHLRSFYAQLREKPLPFATPQIHEVLETQSRLVVSIEERLPGITLKSMLERDPERDMLSQKMGRTVTFDGASTS